MRFYLTYSYERLSPSLKKFADRQLGGVRATPDMKVLTLIATVGQRPEWSDRRRSLSHQAIPLPSAQIVERAPMIAQLIKQMGLDISVVVKPAPEVVSELAGKTYNVFHVPEAYGSPYIPAQDDFVMPHRIRSVVGFGGVLRTGDLFAVIMFSRDHIPADSAARFKNIALDVKAILFPLAQPATFG